MHPITHVGNVPLATLDGQQNKIGIVLYVPTITKNLASVGQMCEQDMQVCFNKYGCLIEDFKNERVGQVIAKSKKKGRCLFWIRAHHSINKNSMGNMVMNIIVLQSYSIGALDMLICKS